MLGKYIKYLFILAGKLLMRTTFLQTRINTFTSSNELDLDTVKALHILHHSSRNNYTR